MDWRVYYDDIEPVTSSTPPDFVPASGVQAIVQRNDNGFEVLNGEHYYVWKDAKWYAMNEHGLWDYLSSPGWKRVLFGRYITKSAYNDILVTAQNDTDFPHKSAWDSEERR